MEGSMSVAVGGRRETDCPHHPEIDVAGGNIHTHTHETQDDDHVCICARDQQTHPHVHAPTHTFTTPSFTGWNVCDRSLARRPRFNHRLYRC